MRLIFLGLPGVGKGTQAEKVEKELNIPQISTGDILRENVRADTELGIKAKTYMDDGKLVPDDIIIKMMKSRLDDADCSNGFILDGFPRTIEQANALESITHIDKVIFIDVPVKVLIARLSGRRSCKECNSVFHLLYKPPKKQGICDECGGELYQRDDDKEKTIKNRIKTYNSQTKPLVKYYKKKNLLVVINGNGTIEETSNKVEKALKD